MVDFNKLRLQSQLYRKAYNTAKNDKPFIAVCESAGLDPFVMKGLVCQYCHKKTRYSISSAFIYGKDYGPLYHCSDCKAYVGVHKLNEHNIALGMVANYSLRQLKKKAHSAFDLLWKHKGSLPGNTLTRSRADAYAWLSKVMDIHPILTHIGMMNEEQCNKVYDLCYPYVRKINAKMWEKL